MTTMRIALPFNFFHFVLLFLIIFILSTTYIYISILFIFLIIVVHKHKLILNCSIIVILITCVFMILEPKALSTTTFDGVITVIEERDYTNKLTVKTNNVVVYVYLSKSTNVAVGEYGRFVCTKSNNSLPTYNGSFDYNEYLYNSYIDGIYFCSSFTLYKNKFVVSTIQDSISKYFSSVLEGNSLKYSLMLILGIDSFSDEESDMISNLGIMHLFCISGMHINFLLMIVSLLLNKFKLSKNKIEVVQVFVALFLLIITNFSISVIRAFLMLLLSFIFKKLNYKVSSLDTLCISAILILIFRPRYIYLVSFQLTYLVSFIIILTSDLSKNKSLLQSLIIQSTVAFSVTFPIIVNINYKINFLTIFYTTFISIPFSYIILPLSFITGICRINFFEPIYNLFNNILFEFSNINFLIFSITKLNIITIIVYYVILFLLLKSIYVKKYLYRYISTLSFLIFFIVNSSMLNNVTTVTFFSVGQGDSSLISLAYNKGNILIDAFGGVSDYIKTRGIQELDYVIITHAHNDHIGDLDEIKKNYNIKNLVGSYYDYEAMKLGFDTYVKNGDSLTLDNIVINFIAPYETHSDLNLTSLVFTINIHGYTFMYTGDTTVEVETQMINNNEYLKSDVLKVPHHGSSTSSSVEFINAVNPLYAIFSYGESNSYGLPNYEIVNRYSQCISYHTPIDGHIEFYYKKKWLIRLYN